MISGKTILTRVAALAIIAASLGASAALPTAAHADNTWQRAQHQQSNKNTWRNLGYGAAAIGAYGFITQNSTVGLLGTAGAVYSAERYEQDRHHQSQDQNQRSGYGNQWQRSGREWNQTRGHGQLGGAGYRRQGETDNWRYGRYYNSAHAIHGEHDCANGR